jgi:hypothetical protein
MLPARNGFEAMPICPPLPHRPRPFRGDSGALSIAVCPSALQPVSFSSSLQSRALARNEILWTRRSHHARLAAVTYYVAWLHVVN